MIDFDWAAKHHQPACKTLRVWTKNEENFEKFQQFFLFRGAGTFRRSPPPSRCHCQHPFMARQKPIIFVIKYGCDVFDLLVILFFLN